MVRTRSAGSPIARFRIAVFLAILGLAVAPSAAAKYASIVVDAHSGKVLHAVNADTRNYPASLTKLMTLYLIFERLEKKLLHRSSELTVSRRAARQPASRLGLQAGSTITVEKAIRALVVKSANDVASTVADNLGGGEKQFARMMTAKARDLGMSRTTFRNSSGLPHRAQLSTARDMAILARAMLHDFPQFYHYFSLKTFTFGNTTHRSHNKLLKTYRGADGLKTGYIRASGFNLVTSVKRGGRRIIGVVFGGRTARSRDAHMVKLLDRGFDRLAPRFRSRVAEAPKAKPSPRSSRPPGADTSRDRWGIQVGAYARHAPARDQAVKILNMAGHLLPGGRIAVVPLRTSNGRILYRSRIVDLDKDAAYKACRFLERNRVDCLELRVKKGVQLAATGAG